MNEFAKILSFRGNVLKRRARLFLFILKYVTVDRPVGVVWVFLSHQVGYFFQTDGVPRTKFVGNFST